MVVKEVTTLQVVQENQKMVDDKAREEHSVQQALNNFQSVFDKV